MPSLRSVTAGWSLNSRIRLLNLRYQAMKLQEFQEAANRWRRFGTFYALAIFLWLILIGIIFSQIPKEWIRQSIAIPVSLLCLLVLGAFAIMLGYTYYLPRRWGLFCPSCNKVLTPYCQAIAIASGHCGYCGQQILH